MSISTTLRGLISSVLASGQSSASITPTRVASVHTETANCLDKISPIYPSGDTSGSTDTTAITTAISSGGVINLAPGSFYITTGSISLSSKTGIIIRGSGRNTTIINVVSSTGDAFTFSGSNNCGLESVCIQGTAATPPTAGWAIKFTGNCFECWTRNILVQWMFNAINIHDSTETHIYGKTTLRPIAGQYGILFDGTAGTGSFRAVIEDVATDNYWVTAFGGFSTLKGNWAASTTYATGNIVFHGSNVYQCVSGGTSSSGGPSGISFTSNVSDGSATWRFIMNESLTWITQDSYASSLVIDKAALLDGMMGFAMTDSVGSGFGVSAPQWCEAFDLECDHSYLAGINLSAGSGFYATDSWIGSCLAGNGIAILSTFSGEFEITNTRIVGNAQNGISNSAPNLFGGISRCCISTNSVSSTGTYYGIAVAANASNFSIQNNFIGATNTGSSYQAYGVLVASGTSNHYQVSNNNCPGNVSGAVFDGGSGATKNVAGNTA